VLPFVQRYNVSNRRPEGLDTLETILDVDNDVAYNALVEVAKFEQCAIFATAADAQATCLHGPPGSQTMFRNVSRAYDKQGNFLMVRNGNYSYSRMDVRNRFQFTQDLSGAITQAKADLSEREAELRGARGQAQEAQAAYQELGKRQKACDARSTATKRHLTTLEQKLRVEKRKLEDMATVDAPDTTEWEEEVKEIEGQLDETTNQIREIQQRRKDATAQVKDFETEKKELVKTVTALSKNIHDAEVRLTNIAREHTKQQAQLKQGEDKINANKKELEDMRAAVAKREAEAEKVEAMAVKFTHQNLGEEAPVPMKVPRSKSEQYFKTKAEQLEQRKKESLESIPANRRDFNVVAQRLQEKRDIFEKKQNELKKVSMNIQSLGADVERRLKKWKKFRKTITELTNTRFEQTLQRKGQTGRVQMDHKDRTLEFSVQKDNRDSMSQIESVKLLSGGERSYATLSFLIALGDALECPFRVMDEFDVFMDQVSRRVALDLLIEQGRICRNRQFILITPQDLSSVTPAVDVKIFKLPDPKRTLAGQQTLEFARA